MLRVHANKSCKVMLNMLYSVLDVTLVSACQSTLFKSCCYSLKQNTHVCNGIKHLIGY